MSLSEPPLGTGVAFKTHETAVNDGVEHLHPLQRKLLRTARRSLLIKRKSCAAGTSTEKCPSSLDTRIHSVAFASDRNQQIAETQISRDKLTRTSLAQLPPAESMEAETKVYP